MTDGQKKFATSFNGGFLVPEFEAVAQRIEVPRHLDVLPRQRFRPDLELLLFLRVLRATLASGAALLFSSRGYMKPELLACILMSFLPKRFRPIIVLYGEMFQPDTGILRQIERAFMKLVDRGICFYVVYSVAELENFPKLWGVDKSKMRFCPFFIDRRHLRKRSSTNHGGKYVLAGGNSHREYGPVIEAARQLPDYEFVLATKKLTRSKVLPPNVRVDWMSLDEYLELMATAAVVLVPLNPRLERTSGQATILEALALEKVVVVPDAFGIRDYVIDGKTGLVVTDLPDGYVKAIRWALAPENRDQVHRMSAEGRKSVLEQFTLEKHIEIVMAIMAEAIEKRRFLL